MTKSNDQIALEVAEKDEKRLVEELLFIRAYIARLKDRMGENTDNRNDVSISEPKIEYSTKNDSRPENYKSDMGIAKKFVTILKHYNRFIHFREVADLVNKFDNTSIPTGDLTNKISTSVQSLKGRHIVKFQAKGGHRNTFWGLKDWLNEDKTIKPGYEYNEEYIHKSNATEDLF